MIDITEYSLQNGISDDICQFREEVDQKPKQRTSSKMKHL